MHTEKLIQRSILQEVFRGGKRFLFHLAEDPSIHVGIIMVYWIFDLIQFLSFPFVMEPAYMWYENSVMRLVMAILAPIMFVPAGPEASSVDATPTSSDSLYFAAVAFLVLLWGSFIWGSYYHIQPPVSALQAALAGRPINALNGSKHNGIDSRELVTETAATGSGLTSTTEIVVNSDNLMIPYWILRFVRTIIFLGFHALFIPITTTLIAPFYCPSKGYWPTSSNALICFDSIHLGFFVASIVLLPLWIMWNILIASCLVNRIPDLTGKRNILCASHGRVFGAIVLLKAVLSGLYIFSAAFNAWVYCIILTLAGIAYVFLYWNFLPYFHQWINQLQLSIGCVFTTASISLLVAQIIGDPHNYAGVASCLALMIPAVYVGYALGSLRFRSFSFHGDLFSPFAVELRMRFLISELINQLGNANEAVIALTRSRSDGLYAESKDKSHSSSKKTSSTDEEHNVDEEKSLLRKNDVTAILNASLESIDLLFKDAIGVFSTSAILQLFYAQYVGAYRHNEHLERIYLRLAETRADQLSFDIQFFVQQRRMELRNVVSTSGNRTMNIERRMQFESLQELSRFQVSETRNLILSFWTELSNKHPDLTRLQKVGITINKSIADTRITFQELLNVAPQSASDMRVYADFLLELANDPARAIELLTDAEQLEEERSKAHQSISNTDLVFGNLVPEFDLSSESLAWCKVSADPTKLGIIVDVNPSMLKLFGYNRREMIGREMSFLVPEPIGSLHPRIMQRYQTTGKERIVNQPRSLLALHRNGYIFPIKINIRPTAEEFITAFEEIPSNLAFMFFLGADKGWKVTAACKTSLSAFHFNVSQMRNGTVSLKNLCSDIGSTLAPLMNSNEQFGITLGDVRIKARLQITPIACLTTPLYVLRYRIVGYNTAHGDSSYVDKKHGIDNDADNDMENDEPIRRGSSSDGHDHEDAHSDAADHDSSSDDGNSSDHDGPERSSYRPKTGTIASKPSPSSHFVASPVSGQSRTPFSATKKSVHPPISLDDDINLCPVMGNGGINNSKKNSTVTIASLPGQTDNPSSSHFPSSTVEKVVTIAPMNGVSNVLYDATMIEERWAESKDTEHRDGNDNGSESNTHTPPSNDPVIPNTPSHSGSLLKMTDSLGEARSLRIHEPSSVDHTDTSDADEANTNTNSDRTIMNKSYSSSSVHPSPQSSNGGSETYSDVSHHNNNPSNINVRGTSGSGEQYSNNSIGNTMILNRSSNSNTNNTAITYGRPLPITMPNKLMDDDHPHNGSDDDLPVNRKATEPKSPKPIGSVKMGGTIISKGSGMSASTVSDLLRKGVAASGAKLERSLLRLRRSIIIVFAVIATLNLISLVVTTVLFSELKRNLLLVVMNGDRALEMNRAVGHIQSLVLSAEQKFTIPEGPSYIQGKLTLWVNKLETLHRELYLSIDNSIPEEVSLYTEPNIRIYDLVPGSYVNRTSWQATERYVGLANGILELISQIRLVQALPDNNITLDHTPVWFVLNNGMTDLHAAVNRSLMLSDERTAGHVARIELANLIVMIIAESTLCVIILCIMLPAVNSVAETKLKVFTTFLEVPLPIIRALRNRVQKKLDALMLAENEDDHAGIDIDNEGDGTALDFIGLDKNTNGSGMMGTMVTPRTGGSAFDHTALDRNVNARTNPNGSIEYAGIEKPRSGTPGRPMSITGGSTNSYDTSLTRTMQAYQAKLQSGGYGGSKYADEDDDERTTCCGFVYHGSLRNVGRSSRLPISIGDVPKHRRRFRNTKSTKLMASLSMILPVLCYVLYFAVVYEWRYLASVDVRYIKAEILWSKQAQIYTGLSNMYVRDSIAYPDPHFVDYSLNMTIDAGDNLEYLQNGLLYGAEVMSLRPGIHLDRNVYQLAMVDGCVEANEDSYNMSTCQSTFYHGIFGKGFMQGFREYIHLNRQIVKSTRAILRNDPSLMTLYDPVTRLNSAIVNDLDQMRWRYLKAGLSEFTRLRLLLTNNIFDSFLVTNIVITVSTILLLQIFYTMLYKPMIRTMNTEIKNVRLLLLLFPDEVSKQVPAIIAAGKELLSDNASVSSGSTL